MDSAVLMCIGCISMIGIFCSSFLLITIDHKRSSLPFFSIMSYVMFLIVYLFIGCMAFLELFSDDMFLMGIVATICFAASIGISYKIKEDWKGKKFKKASQILFWCCILLLHIIIQTKF